jgi:hypothetical protein
MLIVLALVAVAVAIGAGATAIAGELRRTSEARTMLRLLALFSPAAARAADDPRRLLAWHQIAATSRALFPDAFRRLDAARGATFPFSVEDVQAAHARWTTEWLAWERAHDEEFTLKAAAAEEAIARQDSPAARARLAAVEREKLERYQQRYEEYVRVGKGLAALFADPKRHGFKA